MIPSSALILETIFDTLPSGMLLFETGPNQLRINQKALEILGFHSGQSLLPFQEAPPGLSPLLDIVQQDLPDVNRAEITLFLPGRDEETTIGYSLKTLVAPPPQTVIKILTFTDISQMIKDRLALDKIKDELSQSRKLASIGTMIAGVAHELNNPLTGISMSASLVKMNLERLQSLPDIATDERLSASLDKAVQEVQKITRANEKASVLVKDLLSYSKPTQLHLVVLPLQTLLLDVISALKTHPQFSRFTIHMEGQTDCLVQCDRVKLEQVFYNLIKNAADATEGKGTLRLFFSETSATPSPGRPLIVTHVQDDGPGIEKTIISRIFDPFFTTKGHGGVGLGLSICYRTMEQHGGSLSVESVKGKGTEFKVALPVYLE